VLQFSDGAAVVDIIPSSTGEPIYIRCAFCCCIMGFFTLHVYTPPHLLRIRMKIWIRQIRIFLGLLDPDPDQLVRGMDPDPNPSSIKQK
jgi:hypothetical protein